MKELLEGMKNKISKQKKAGNLSKQDSGRLLACVANHRVGLGSFCPLAEIAI